MISMFLRRISEFHNDVSKILSRISEMHEVEFSTDDQCFSSKYYPETVVFLTVSQKNFGSKVKSIFMNMQSILLSPRRK